MNNTFELKRGKLVFEEDKIVISDNEKIWWRLMLLFSASAVILVLTAVVAYFTTGDQYETWFGFFVGIAFVLAFVVSPFRSVQSEIDLKEVKSLKLTRGLFKEFLEIKLTNNKIRRVYEIVDKVGLREYIANDSLTKPVFERNRFELKNGKLVFEEDKIIITDKAKSQRIQMIFLAGSGLLLGVTYLLQYFKKGDQFGLWFGLFIVLGNILGFVLFFMHSVQSEVSLKDVKSMKVRKRAGNEFLDIKLNNNRTRRVTQIFNPDRLKDYIDTISLPK